MQVCQPYRWVIDFHLKEITVYLCTPEGNEDYAKPPDY